MSHFWTSAHLWGDKVYLREYVNGERIKVLLPADIKPYLFFPGQGEYKTLDGQSCYKRHYEGWRDARDAITSNEGVSNHAAYGMSQFLYTHLNDNFPGTVDYDPSIIARGSIDIETDSEGSFPNIAEADKAITAITLSRRQHGKRKIIMFGLYPYKVSNPEVTYVMCKDEPDLLENFLAAWESDEWSPDIITGWNIEGFDIPYIINRIRRILGEGAVKRLSPYRIVRDREISRGQSVGQKTSTQVVYEIFGISILDYMELYKKFSFKNQESFRLDHIAFVELGRRKKDYSEYGSLDNFYKKNFQGFMDYNLEDTILVDDIDDKCGFLELVMAFAYDAKVTFNDTMTTTRPWDVIIHNYLLEKNIVVPQSLGSTSGGSIVGGYVKDVKEGLFRGVASFDFDSLYPHLIMGWNISPETYIGRVFFDAPSSLKRGTFEADVAQAKEEFCRASGGQWTVDQIILAGNGCIFRKDKKGFLPVLMDKMYQDRVAYKKLMLQAKKDFEATKDPKFEKLIAKYHNLQLAKKIQLNSAFGALANEYFRWFANYLAEAITTSGQMSTMWTEIGINAFMNKVLKTTNSDYVIAADTDSLYLNLEPLIKSVDMLGKPVNEVIDFMEAACVGKIQKVIDARCQALTDLVGCPTNKLKMKREALANKGIWTAKKKYLLNVWDLEGVRYKEAQLKVTGIETVRSSTPQVCRDKLKKAIKIIIDGTEDELQDLIGEFREEFRGKPFHEVASPRGVRGLHEYRDAARIYKKGTPIQVRGALLFNKQVKDLNLGDKYQPITNGSKIKFCYLKIPNPIRENVIAVPETLPAEFGLENFIDYDLQYEKTFIAPIEKIVSVIGWSTEKSGSLLDFL